MRRNTFILILFLLVSTATGATLHILLGPPEGTVPVHRFWFKPAGSHFYTSSEAEVTNLKNNYSHVYVYEGIVGYWFPNVVDIADPNIIEVRP